MGGAIRAKALSVGIRSLLAPLLAPLEPIPHCEVCGSDTHDTSQHGATPNNPPTRAPIPAHPLAPILVTMIGMLQRILDELDDAFGMPRGDPVIQDIPSPAQNTVYYSTPVPVAAVLRSLTVSHNGAGKITLYLVGKNAGPHALAATQLDGNVGGTARILCRPIWISQMNAQETCVPVDGIRVRVPAGCAIGIATNQAAIANIGFAAMVDQLDTRAIPWHYGRR